MAKIDERKRQLSDLECHFKWKPEGDVMVCNITKLETKLLTNIDENPFIAVEAYALLSYLFAVGNVHANDLDYSKVDEYEEKALDKVNNNGQRYVIFANKLHILFERRKMRDFDKVLSQIKELSENMPNIDKSKIKIMEAFALSRFGLREFNISLERYKEAVSLDPDSADGYFGIGLIMGRIRRFHFGHTSYISDDEIEAFKKSVDLWKYTNPFPVTWYAYVLTCSITPTKGFSTQQQRSKFAKIDSLFDKAISLVDSYCSGSSIIYKWCAKGYKQITRKARLPRNLYLRYIKKQKFCIDRACDANPNDSSSFHEAALLYWRVNMFKNLAKAQKLLQKACECCPLGNFLADVDYILFRKQNEKEFSALDGFVMLLRKYEHRDRSSPFDDLNIARLHMYVGLEVLHGENDEDAAKEEFMEALRYDPKCLQVKDAKTKLLNINENRLNKIRSTQFTDKAVEIKILFELGNVHELTGNNKEAKIFFKEIVDLDEKHYNARFELCKILYEEGSYHDCVHHCIYLIKEDSNESFVAVKKLLAKSNYYLAISINSDDDIPQKECLIFQSAKLGLLDSCYVFLGILDERLHNNMWYHTTQEMYETCVQLLLPEYFKLCEKDNIGTHSLVNSPQDFTEKIKNTLLKWNLCKHDEFSRDLLGLRNMRYEMTQTKLTQQKMEIQIQVLLEARNQLDRSFRKFIEANFPGVKIKLTHQKFYFPYLEKPEETLPDLNQRLRSSQEAIEIKIEHPKRGMGLKGFKSLFPALFQFLCEHQPVYDCKYNFVPEFCKNVNYHKHGESLFEKDLYEIAHSACSYVEEVLHMLDNKF